MSTTVKKDPSDRTKSTERKLLTRSDTAVRWSSRDSKKRRSRESSRNLAGMRRNPEPRILVRKNQQIEELEKKIALLEEKLELYERKSDSVANINKIKEHYFEQMVQSTEFGKALNCTRQNINRLRREHKVLAVSGKNGNYYPMWQLDENNHPYSCIVQVIDTLGFDNQWTIIQFFHTRFELINDKTPIEYLKHNPKDNLKIAKLARQYMAN